jgi:hypothetical protein
MQREAICCAALSEIPHARTQNLSERAPESKKSPIISVKTAIFRRYLCIRYELSITLLRRAEVRFRAHTIDRHCPDFCIMILSAMQQAD